jgi:hypothetical protein
MRILTVRQPWAWAIIHGGKDVENRSRNIAGSYRGPVAIHAAIGATAQLTEGDERLLLERDIGGKVGAWMGGEPIEGGVILGVVNLWAVHKDRDGGNCCPHRPVGGPGGSRWAERDVWHLCLNDPRPLRMPIPYKGALGLRELPADAANDVLGSLA